MNKIVTISVFSAIVGLCSFSAQAIENDYKPYIGVSYAYSDTHNKQGNSYNNSGIFHFGSVYNKYFGTELFYQYSDKHKFDGASALKSTKLQAYGLDMMGYLPLGCEGRWVPTLTAGIGEYTFKHNYRSVKSRRDHGWGYRFGGGLTYNIDDSLSVRAIARYIKLDGVKDTDHMNEYIFGIRYTFN